MTPSEILAIEDILNGMNLCYKRFSKNFTIGIPFVTPMYSKYACLHIPTDIKSFRIQLKITKRVLLDDTTTTLLKGGNWILLNSPNPVPNPKIIETEIINAYKTIQGMGVAY